MGRPINKRKFGDTANAGLQIVVSARPTSSAAANGYIVKQKSAKRFLCTNADGTAALQLVTTAPAEGECRITLVDNAGGTYYASKLSARKVRVVQGTGTVFANGTSVKWSTAAATATTLRIQNG